MNHNNRLPANPHDWNDRHVRLWLKRKGFGLSIQNKFFKERIDGDALLCLTHEDIEGIIQMFPFGDKAKVRYHVDALIAKTKSIKQSRSDDLKSRKCKRKRTDEDPLKKHNGPRKRRKIRVDPSMRPGRSGGSSRRITKYSITTNNALPSNYTNTNNKRIISRKGLTNTSSDEILRVRNQASSASDGAKSKNKKYCYSQINNHDTSNHGARWTKGDLELMWSLHKKGYDYKRLAQHFKRTECGIHVQIYYREKAIKERQNVSEQRRRKQKWIKQLRGDSDLSSSDDDDELVINNIRRKEQNRKEENESHTKQEFHIPSPSPYIIGDDTKPKTKSPSPQPDMSLEYQEMMKEMFDIQK